MQTNFKITQVYLIFPIHHAIHEFFYIVVRMSSFWKLIIHIEDIMMYQKVNSHIPWDSQNPYPRLNQKQALWASSKKKIKKKFNIINVGIMFFSYITTIFFYQSKECYMVRPKNIIVKK